MTIANDGYIVVNDVPVELTDGTECEARTCFYRLSARGWVPLQLMGYDWPGKNDIRGLSATFYIINNYCKHVGRVAKFKGTFELDFEC